jgi:hypothetical protein
LINPLSLIKLSTSGGALINFFFYHIPTHIHSPLLFNAPHIILIIKDVQKERKKKGEKRITWGGKHATYIINFFIKEYKNKASTTRAWSEKMKKKTEKFKDLNVTDAQIKNFISAQSPTSIVQWRQKKESTDFGDDEELGSAEDQLIDICRYWYKSIHIRTR